jgi:hypothetical protein
VVADTEMQESLSLGSSYSSVTWRFIAIFDGLELWCCEVRIGGRFGGCSVVASSGGGGRSSKLFNEIQWVLDFRCDGFGVYRGTSGQTTLSNNCYPLILAEF